MPRRAVLQAAGIRPLHTAVSGRARLEVPGLHRNPRLKAFLEARLPGRDIMRARASSATGNLVVLYDRAMPLAAILRRVEDALAASRDSGAEPHLAWHAASADNALARLGSCPRGLTPREAARRLRRHGRNRLVDLPGRSRWEMLADQLGNLPTALLAASAGLSLLTGGVLDAGVILGVLALNGAIGFFAEAFADKTIRSLSYAGVAGARVVRDGAERLVDADELVPGDVIELRPGDLVPADARLIEAEHLTVNEASLTGESLPVGKSAAVLVPPRAAIGDRRNLVHRGTAVTGGSGRAVVVATGADTEIGRVQALAGSALPPRTPLQRQIDELARQLTFGSALVCATMFAIGWLRGFGLVPMLKSAISLGIAAIPEGLPTMATASLALAIEDLRREKVLVRRLGAVEGLAAVGMLCFDKTGTLTFNRMLVTRVAGVADDAGRRDGRLAVAGQPDLRQSLELAALCNDAEPANGKGAADGSSTELALLQAAADAGIDVAELRRRRPRLDVSHRAEGRRYMLTAHDAGDAGVLIALKGDPEEVLGLCRHVLRGGDRVPLDRGTRDHIAAQNRAMAEDGLRVLGIAWRMAPRDGLADIDAEPTADFVWAGLVGMADSLRPGMPRLISRLHAAGIRTAMVTGDQPATAAAIARELGLGGARVQVLDNGGAGDPSNGGGAVFARVAPAQKLDIVRVLQRSGFVVAMIGDGVNDTPALKAADIGITLGGAGTEAARRIADLVLLDDDLGGVLRAVARSRTVYANLRRGIRFLLATNLGEIVLMLFAVTVGSRQPLTPLQLLWINLLTDVLPAVGLALEPPEPAVMRRPPPAIDEPLVPPRDYAVLGRDAALMAGGAFLAESWARRRHGNAEDGGGAAFASLAFSQLFYALTCRPEVVVAERRNYALAATLGSAAAAQAAALLVPGLRRLLGAPRSPLDLGVALVSGALPILAIEALKPGRRG